MAGLMLTLLLDLVCHRFYLPPPRSIYALACEGDRGAKYRVEIRLLRVRNGWFVHALWVVLVILGSGSVRYASLIYHCCVSAEWLSQYSGWDTGRSSGKSGFDSRKE